MGPLAFRDVFRWRWVALLLLWATAVGAGGAVLWKYAVTAGAAAAPPERWPAQSSIAREKDRATLVVLAHPRCPCTRATLTELGVLMARVGQKARAHVLFVRPRGLDTGWEKTTLWQSAASIEGVTVHSDPGGTQAALFDAATSGQVVVYDSAGRLIFRGGITGARGHEGDNVGLERALTLINGGRADGDQSQVFGCSLDGPVAASGDERP
jgi:hypothetical protein